MSTSITRRELAHRMSNGISVSLFWDKVGDMLTLEVHNEGDGEHFEIDVPRDRALDAFHHPYAYRLKAEVRELAEPLVA
jgi:hypothetical protein